MDKIMALLKKLGIELTADQTKQIDEVLGKEFVTAADAAKTVTELEDIKKQLSDRDADLAKLKNDATSADLRKQLDDLTVKYKNDTDALNAKLEQQKHDHAAERFFGGRKISTRISARLRVHIQNMNERLWLGIIGGWQVRPARLPVNRGRLIRHNYA